MKRILLPLILLAAFYPGKAQNVMYVHKAAGTDTFEVTDEDNASFNEDKTQISFSVSGEITTYDITEIDSITFEIDTDSTVYIDYNGSTASVVNPLEGAGINTIIDGADVYIQSTVDLPDINYVVSGSTSDGMLKLYSERRFNLLLNGVTLSNLDGPAINIQSGKKVSVNLSAGTTSTLTDGTSYTDPGNDEDQDAALFSEGQLVFTGSGSLVINGNGTGKDGIRSDDYIRIEEGTINVLSASNDGIHGKDGFFMNGGTISILSSGDGVDAGGGSLEISGGTLSITSISDDVKGMNCDTTLLISGGNLDLNIAGNQSKGIHSDQEMFISGGAISITTSGGVVLEASGIGYDPSYCTAINSNGNITITGTDITISSTGAAGKGIACDGNMEISDADIRITASGNGAKYTTSTGSADAYFGSCLNTDGDLYIQSGEYSLIHSGSGGRGISTDGALDIGDASSDPVLNVTTSGSKITITSSSGTRPGDSSGEYAESKAIKCDGIVTIKSGEMYISSADDGIKSTTGIIQNGGLVQITKSIEGVESPSIQINDGEINIVSSDDGFNATKGNGGETNDGSLLAVNGGHIVLNATTGDPLDSNGNITISGGTTIVHGPQSSPEVGMDVNGTCLISGGFLVVSGTNSNMTEGASSGSSQYSILVKSNTSIAANSIFHIEDSDGNNVLSFAPMRTYYSIVFSSDQLKTGTTYKIYTGGSDSGTLDNGLYTGGTYTPGTLRKSFTISSSVTTVSF